MTTFNWLHFSDLHWGTSGQKARWSTITTALFKDIKYVMRKAGIDRWDAVFFTGDLVNRGGDYKDLNSTLLDMWRFFRDETGSAPVLLPVPGNHDLVRPILPSNRNLLAEWNAHQQVRDDFWGPGRKSEYREIVATAFTTYQDWWDRLPDGIAKPSPDMRLGFLPGDFAVVLPVDKYTIGVIGLNTAFMQLQDDPDNHLKKMEVDPVQICELCGYDYEPWFRRSTLNLLLTHHHPTWLIDAAERGVQAYNTFIAPPGRFNLHLCGHMHQEELSSVRIGAAAERNIVQAASLVCVGDEPRTYGYCAGSISLAPPRAIARFWPRKGVIEHAGAYKFDKFPEWTLQGDEGTKPIILLENLPVVETVPLFPPIVDDQPGSDESEGQQEYAHVRSEIEKIFSENGRVKICLTEILSVGESGLLDYLMNTPFSRVWRSIAGKMNHCRDVIKEIKRILFLLASAQVDNASAAAVEERLNSDEATFVFTVNSRHKAIAELILSAALHREPELKKSKKTNRLVGEYEIEIRQETGISRETITSQVTDELKEKFDLVGLSEGELQKRIEARLLAYIGTQQTMFVAHHGGEPLPINNLVQFLLPERSEPLSDKPATRADEEIILGMMDVILKECSAT